MKHLLIKIFAFTSLLAFGLSCQKNPEQAPLQPHPEKKILRVDFLGSTESLISGESRELNWMITYSDSTIGVIPSTRVTSNNNSVIITKGSVITAEHYGNAIITASLITSKKTEHSVKFEISVTPEDRYLKSMGMLRNLNNLDDYKNPIINAGESFQLKAVARYEISNGEKVSVILPFNDKRIVKWDLQAMNHNEYQEKIFKYDNKTGIIQTFITDGRFNRIWVKLTYRHPLYGEVTTNEGESIEIY